MQPLSSDAKCDRSIVEDPTTPGSYQCIPMRRSIPKAYDGRGISALQGSQSSGYKSSHILTSSAHPHHILTTTTTTTTTMRPTTPMRRALAADGLAASLRSSSAGSSSSSHPTSARRQLATASAELPSDGIPELHIFDIFDAPARLGTSPTRLRLPPRSPPSPRPKQMQRQPTRLMMPSPVLFDGPSGTPPRKPSASMSSSSPASSSAFSDSLPKSLPPPETFDGPARMRGPTALRAEKKTPWLTPSFFMINLLGLSGAAGFLVIT
ncbi:hypothetical protein C8Q72DRAFT_625165 [Fomitopsis betulina]|nr:hypothetical protein C8Q72DRAFT_625165 [Fomitopsis betulina]